MADTESRLARAAAQYEQYRLESNLDGAGTNVTLWSPERRRAFAKAVAGFPTLKLSVGEELVPSDEPGAFQPATIARIRGVVPGGEYLSAFWKKWEELNPSP